MIIILPRHNGPEPQQFSEAQWNIPVNSMMRKSPISFPLTPKLPFM